MPRKSFPPDIIKQAREIVAAWKEINPSMYFGPVSSTALNENLHASSILQAQVAVLEIQLAELRSQHDTSNKRLWEMIRRVRAGIKASYGEDSPEYRRICGTHVSEHTSVLQK